MRRYDLLIWLSLLPLSVPSVSAHAQAGVPGDLAPLRSDGNGIPALRTIIQVRFDSITAADAFATVAARAKLQLIFDSQLRGLDTRITIPTREASAAELLLAIADRSHLRVNVASDGRVVVTETAGGDSRAAVVRTDSAARAGERAVLLPVVRTEAELLERREFETKPNASSVSMSGRQLGAAPRFFAEADVLRAVQLLPGVEARNDYSAAMNVRGGEADQNLILLDGYPIYNPFHLGGLFGTFIDPTVGRIEMITAGFPARYGGRLSSVLDVRSAEESRRGIHGTAEASLISSTLSLSGATNDGKGSWSVAARRTYADKAMDLYKSDALPYHFRDAQAHVTRSLPWDLRLSLTAYDGVDRVDVTSSDERFFVAWGNRVLGSTLSKTFHARPRMLGMVLGDSATVEQRLSSSRFHTTVDLANGTYRLQSLVDDRRVGGALTAFGPVHQWTLGYELASQRLGYSLNREIPLLPLDSLGGRVHSTSFYVDDLWRPARSLIVEAGARVDMVDAPHWTGVQPRMAIKYFLNDHLAVTAAAGEYAQWVRSLSREDVPVRPLDFWARGSASTPVSRARHYAAGLERWLAPARMLRVEGFFKSYHNLLEPNPRSDLFVAGDEFVATAGGHSYGADFLLRQVEGKRFSGWLAYTYTVSSRMTSDGTRYFPAQDRRHDLNFVGSWRLASYTLGGRFGVATGTPYTYVRGDFIRHAYDPVTHDWPEVGATDVQYLTGPRNGDRLPTAHRLDLSVAHQGRLFGAAVSPYISISNAYNARNIFAYVFDYSKLPPTRLGLPQSPILPTIGVSIVW